MVLQQAIQQENVSIIAKIMVNKPTAIGFEFEDGVDDWWANLICEE